MAVIDRLPMGVTGAKKLAQETVQPKPRIFRLDGGLDGGLDGAWKWHAAHAVATLLFWLWCVKIAPFVCQHISLRLRLVAKPGTSGCCFLENPQMRAMVTVRGIQQGTVDEPLPVNLCPPLPARLPHVGCSVPLNPHPPPTIHPPPKKRVFHN